jgi:transcription elongation factor Elf1
MKKLKIYLECLDCGYEMIVYMEVQNELAYNLEEVIFNCPECEVSELKNTLIRQVE